MELNPSTLLAVAALVLALAAAWRLVAGGRSDETGRALLTLATLAAARSPATWDDQAVALLRKLLEEAKQDPRRAPGEAGGSNVPSAGSPTG